MCRAGNKCYDRQKILAMGEDSLEENYNAAAMLLIQFIVGDY